MNWATQNKFLTGFVVTMVIGVGALGFKVFSAKGALEEANDRYTSKSTEYNRLRHLAPYPNREHLDAFEAQKKEAADTITAFQADLATKEFPVEEITPEQFQDRLKVAVTTTEAKAKEGGVVIDEKLKFYLGFNRYETQPPDKGAASALGRELKAIEWVVHQAIDSGVAEIRGLDRPELPEEKGKAAAAPARPERGRPGGERGGARSERQNLVSGNTFDIVVHCRQQRAANLLNAIISPSTPQFYIPRAVKITNDQQKGPQRVVEAPPVAPLAPEGAAPVAPTENVSYLVGEELVELSLRLEIVDFAEPATK